jgi:hypothetical protein
LITFSDFGNYSRLGNQLFQLAFLYITAKKLNTKVFLKGYLFNDPTLYEYKETVVRFLKKVNSDNNIIWVKTQEEYQKIYKENIKTTYNDPTFSHTHVLIDNCDYFGYFQSEKYFIDYKEEIEILFSEINESNIFYFYKNLITSSSNSLSIHIRRGDYTNTENEKIHINLSKTNYYFNCDKFINKNLIAIDNIFVFSDDLEFCKTYFEENDLFKNFNIAYVNGLKNYEDLILQAYCINNIIANSTFSWWGAWLKSDKKNLIFCPSLWFGAQGFQDQFDIYPKQWIKIDC